MNLNITEQYSEFEGDETNQENIQNLSTASEANKGTFEHSLSNGFEKISENREYFFGNDKLHGGRMWIQSFDDSRKYNLYTLYNQNDKNEDLYRCIQCTRYKHRGHQPSEITVKHLQNGMMELFEKRNHYPSCGHTKEFIDKIQQKYHRPPRSSQNGVTKARQSLPTPSLAAQNQNSSNVSRSTESRRKRKFAQVNQSETDSNSPGATPSPLLSRAFFVKPSPAATELARRSRTQAVQQIAAAKNPRMAQDDSVASVFSHLLQNYGVDPTPTPRSNSTISIVNYNPIPRSTVRVSSTNRNITVVNAMDSVTSETTTAPRRSNPIQLHFPASPLNSNLHNREELSPIQLQPQTQPIAPKKSPSTIEMQQVEEEVTVSSVTTIPTPIQMQLPIPLSPVQTVPVQQPAPKPVQFADIKFLQPKLLSSDESFCHCIPSSHTFREMSALLGLDYNSNNQAFWHSTYGINEISGISKPSMTSSITMSKNIGFQAISMFLTSSEESTFKIQESVKQYIFQNLHSYVDKEDENYKKLMKVALCSYQLEFIHLWILTKIINVRIAIFGVEGVQVFGDIFDDSLPSILLKNENDEFLPVLNVRN